MCIRDRCYISHAHTGRSANRGECSQECRLPFTLEDQKGRIIGKDKHYLSMKDNDQSANLRALIDAGVSSFKIEGRYKDLPYVKNATAHYRQLLDEILHDRPELAKSSHGNCTYTFNPVSYTHLDVYKRQGSWVSNRICCCAARKQKI